VSIDFDPKNPPDPADPRIVPASFQFTFVRRDGRVYIEWNIAEVIRMNGQNEKRHYPYLIRTLISPADARAYAKQLLDSATEAEGL
jgi:hypothetical protein